MAAPTLKSQNQLKSQNLRTKKLNPIVPAPEQKAPVQLNSKSPDATPKAQGPAKKLSQRIDTDIEIDDKVKKTIEPSIPESSIEVEDKAKSNSNNDIKSTLQSK